ncbi:MAG: hypothetical protein JOZ93_01735, partial [Sinobacteraceae bacterium]|nr:hypothetical protein [Nevskiaceae bacterium]
EILLMSSGRIIAQGPLAALVIGCPEFQVLSAQLSQRGSVLSGKDAVAAAAA